MYSRPELSPFNGISAESQVLAHYAAKSLHFSYIYDRATPKHINSFKLALFYGLIHVRDALRVMIEA